MDSSTWHVNNLEKVLRFLRNGQLTVQQVEDIKYGIEHYVDNNQEPDFGGADMELYEELGIEGLGEIDEEEGEEEAEAKARKEAEEKEKEAQAKLRERQREEEQSAIERSREAREKAAKAAAQSNGQAAVPTVQADPNEPKAAKAPEVQTMTPAVQQALTGNVAPAQMMLALVTVGLTQDDARAAFKQGKETMLALLQQAVEKKGLKPPAPVVESDDEEAAPPAPKAPVLPQAKQKPAPLEKRR